MKVSRAMPAPLGEQIKALRLQAGLSQQDLSTLVGVTSGIVSRWETGKASPQYPNLVALARALDCRILIDDQGGHLEPQG
jgi:transcriptional regulator with XRE-family HTH domain